MNGSAIVLNLAYISLFMSTFSRSVVWLRAALMVASVAFIIYGAVVGIWSMVFWNIIIGLLHTMQQFKHLRARSEVTISSEDDRFRQMLFPGLNDFDFHLLWSLGVEETMAHQLTHQGVVADSVWLILEGEVEVRSKGGLVSRLAVGSLVGEMSYLSNGPATADTFPVGEILVRHWSAASLRVLAEVNPAASQAIFEAISNDLGSKLSWRTFWA